MIRGGLFTRFFLEDGIRGLPEYARLDAATLTEFAAVVRSHWQALDEMPRPSEAETEAVFINPILARLDWEHLPQQEPGRGREHVADALCFLIRKPLRKRAPSAPLIASGSAQSSSRTRRKTGRRTAPAAAARLGPQLLRYLGRAEAQSGGRLRWGLLTNGRFWRLYWAQARARAEGFVEIDLPALSVRCRLLCPPVRMRIIGCASFYCCSGAIRWFPKVRGGRPFSIAPSTKGAFMNNASPKRCLAPSSGWCRARPDDGSTRLDGVFEGVHLVSILPR